MQIRTKDFTVDGMWNLWLSNSGVKESEICCPHHARIYKYHFVNAMAMTLEYLVGEGEFVHDTEDKNAETLDYMRNDISKYNQNTYDEVKCEQALDSLISDVNKNNSQPDSFDDMFERINKKIRELLDINSKQNVNKNFNPNNN